MKITDYDDVNHIEFAEITRISAMAALRGGVLTTRQQKRIDAILIRAWKREEKKRTEVRAAQARR